MQPQPPLFFFIISPLSSSVSLFPSAVPLSTARRSRLSNLRRASLLPLFTFVLAVHLRSHLFPSRTCCSCYVFLHEGGCMSPSRCPLLPKPFACA
ncbi:hypothetical protein SESBI_35887 [Sesbania bispinosa]|nr:hypothetical protein SESBI_35887 [Sesbania bispinosa]